MLITWKKHFLRGQRYMGHKGNYAIVISVSDPAAHDENHSFHPALILYDDGLVFEVCYVTYQEGFYEVIG